MAMDAQVQACSSGGAAITDALAKGVSVALQNQSKASATYPLC